MLWYMKKRKFSRKDMFYPRKLPLNSAKQAFVCFREISHASRFYEESGEYICCVEQHPGTQEQLKTNPGGFCYTFFYSNRLGIDDKQNLPMPI